MIRYAAHYVYLPDYGFLKQYVVEIREGRISALFPLSSEIENTEWQPGVIAIVASEEEARDLLFRKKNLLDKVPADIVGRLADRMPVLLFPFDFTTMVPVAGTQHRLLR